MPNSSQYLGATGLRTFDVLEPALPDTPPSSLIRFCSAICRARRPPLTAVTLISPRLFALPLLTCVASRCPILPDSPTYILPRFHWSANSYNTLDNLFSPRHEPVPVLVVRVRRRVPRARLRDHLTNVVIPERRRYPVVMQRPCRLVVRAYGLANGERGGQVTERRPGLSGTMRMV
jgi:hypothetical protein